MNRIAIAAHIALACAVVLLPASSRAVAPVLDSLFPAGGQRGTSVDITAAGKLDPWPVQAWADSPQIQITPGKAAGQLTVKIDPNAATGPHLIRLYNGEGASTLRCFVVTDKAEVLEAEPNDDARKPQIVKTLPATINGRLEKPGDVDCYAVTLKAGEYLVASVQGRRLGSPMDPLLHLFDDAGTELAFAHDGLGLDPLLTYRATQPGTYVVRISAFAFPPAADVKLTGGKADIYRLSLTGGPFVRYAFPAGIARGTRATVRLFGWNIDERTQNAEVNAESLPAGEEHLFVPAAGGEGRLRIEVGEGIERLASDVRKSAEPLALPLNITGIIEHPGGRDAFPFAVKKGERLAVSLRAAAAGSPLSGTLRIEDAAGKVIARSEDSAVALDPRIDWVPPADGIYRVTVGDLYRKGGPDFYYRLQIAPPRPGVEAVVDKHEYRLSAGKSVPVKVTVTRKNGYSGELLAVAAHLPPGVTSSSAEIGEKGGEVTVHLTAASDVKAIGQPIQVLVVGTDRLKPSVVVAAYNLRQDKDAPQELVDEMAVPWLTVLSAPASQPASAPTPRPKSKKP